VTGREPLPVKDRLIIAMLVFFVGVAFTLELWWLLHPSAEMVALRQTSLFAQVFDVYGAADKAYFEARTPFAHCLEALNVYFTQLLNGALIWAIWKRKPWRHALQLAVGAYISYSVVLYFLVAHVSGYELMRQRSTANYLLFYGANAPWLLGHLYLVWDSVLAISERFRHRESATVSPERGKEWAEVNDARSAS
jgi:hypothetical protein